MTSWSWDRRVVGPLAQRRAAAALLVRCLRGEAAGDPATPADLAAVPQSMLLALADYHGVSGIAYEQLRRVPAADASLIESLRVAYVRGVEAHLRVIWELQRLQPLLDDTGVPWAVIKGPATVEQLYGAPGRRAYQDLDLLVDPDGFRTVVDALQDNGTLVLDRNWALLHRDLLGEIHLRLPGGTPLDLHWNLINMNRGRMWIDSRDVLSRSVRTRIGPVQVGVLGPEDMLLHHAVHGALSGGDKLLWLKDIERAAAVLTLDWTVVMERAREWGVAAGVGLMLGRARDTLGAPVPAEVPPRLLGGAATRMVELVELVSPWELSVGRLTAASHVVSRTISHGPVRAALWFAGRAIRRLDPREPLASSVFTERGGDRERSAYIDAVVTSRERRRDAS